MTTIAEQMKEMLFDDDRDQVAIARKHNVHENTIGGIIRGKQRSGLPLAMSYVAERGWRWKLAGKDFPGDPAQQLRCAIAESGLTVRQLTEAARCDSRAICDLMTGVRNPHTKTIDSVAVALGLRWILVEAK